MLDVNMTVFVNNSHTHIYWKFIFNYCRPILFIRSVIHVLNCVNGNLIIWFINLHRDYI